MPPDHAGRARPSPPKDMRNEIQWLRAIAACEVVVCHSDLITKTISPDRIIENPLYAPLVSIGVELFFIVSGYIMCMRLPAFPSPWSFITSRVIRIYPLYWLFTAVVVGVALAVPDWRLGQFTSDIETFTRSFLILPGWGYPILGVGWTLEYEMVFYLLVTVLMSLGLTARRPLVAFGWLLACLGFIGCALGPKTEGSSLVYHVFSPYMFAFGIGWLFRAVEQAAPSERFRSVAVFAAIAAAAVWIGSEWSDKLVFRIAGVAVLFAAVVAGRAVFQANNAINRTMWLVGDASYSLYLVHWFVLSAAGKFLGEIDVPAELSLLVRVLGVLAGVAAGIASFFFIEKPLGRLLRRRTRRVRHSAAVPALVPGD